MPPNLNDMFAFFSAKPQGMEKFKRSFRLWNILSEIFFWTIILFIISGLIGLGVLMGKYWL